MRARSSGQSAWGLFASVTALYAANLGSLIEVVNRFGSFRGLIGGMASVAAVATFTDVWFMWHNLVGVAAVCVIGCVSAPRRSSASASRWSMFRS